ncbi:hypothetical protein WJX73_008270 [Symbiochloris irregularis]|uniref:Uncharacterized protein n=1 Tax=Symbiochloris irregularis TaxID=706552 RepID=A0AAW1PRE9_9CHLO
MLSEAGTDSS